MTGVFALEARAHQSRVLSEWIAGRPGAARRTGVVALGENASRTDIRPGDLASALGLSVQSSAGVAVTPDNAMRVSAVYGCVSLIAGAIATLPFVVYERDGSTRRRAEHDYAWMLNEQAFDGMTSATAFEYLIASKLFYGDAFAELLRPGVASTRVIGWKPLHPLAVVPLKDQKDGAIYYRVAENGRPMRVLDSADIIHLPSLGFDGLTSPSPITYAAREVIGIALAAEGYSARFFNGGATFDYALKTESKLGKEQLDQLRESLAARTAKGSRAPLVLSGGLEPAQLSVNPKDAEILSTRLFSVEEICRIFGVPPHMVGHTDKTTSWGSGIEQQGIGFVRYTLQRHLTPCAQEWNRKLWPVRQRYFVEHLTAALERGDLKARYEAYRVALGRAGEMPWVDADEIRRLENMPPAPQLKPNPGSANAQPTAQTAG